MQTLYIKEEIIPNFLEILGKQYQIYLPFEIKGKKLECEFGFDLPASEYLYKLYSAQDKQPIVFNPYRTVEPIRSFFSYPKEKVATYFTSSEKQPSQKKQVAIFGVKNCDLFSLKIQDYVFLEGATKDPLYEERRQNSLLISSDCPEFKESCFCLALDINPFVNEGFDLNFSHLNDGFIVDVGSVKAQAAIKESAKFFTNATSSQLSARDQKRGAVVEKLKEHLKRHKIPKKEVLQEAVTKGYDSKLWAEEAQKCVECGGCNFMCDTCHCFLLSDERFGRVNEKIRLWDACLYANFAKVAGGANPLKYRHQRLRNRYLKKFDFFPDNLGLAACCGCGRCIDVCPAKIDIRQILKRLEDEKSLCAR